jgi:glucose 1-dehydrogenase
MPQLQNRIALITGSDSGIGRGIAVAFAEEGADVLVTWHTDEAGAQETRRMVEACGRRTIVERLEVTDPASVKAMFDAAEALGEVDILVNNAGLSSERKPFAETTDEDFDAMLKTDLYGPFYGAREFVRRRKSGGRTLNITSVHEVTPSPEYTQYNAAKGGLLAWPRGLALELAPMKITVNAIAPGLTVTPRHATASRAPRARRASVRASRFNAPAIRARSAAWPSIWPRKTPTISRVRASRSTADLRPTGVRAPETGSALLRRSDWKDDRPVVTLAAVRHRQNHELFAVAVEKFAHEPIELVAVVLPPDQHEAVAGHFNGVVGRPGLEAIQQRSHNGEMNALSRAGRDNY